MNSVIRAISAGLVAAIAGVAMAQDPVPPKTPKTEQAPVAARQSAVEASTNPAVWLQRAATAYDAGDFAAVEAACLKLVELRPYVGEYGYLLAKSYALQSKLREAYDKLIKLSEEGLSFDLSLDPDMENLRPYPVYEYIVEKFEVNAGPHGNAQTALTISRQDLLIDGLAWDAKGDQLLIGSIREGKVLRVGADGQLETLVAASAGNGLSGVLDIAVDNERGWLWVATAGLPQFKGLTAKQLGRTGVAKFDLQTGKLIKRYQLVADGIPHLLANLAVSPDGDLFISDVQTPSIYRISNDVDQLALFMVAPGLTDLRDMVVDPAGKFLYVADYEQGLFRLDLVSSKLYQLGKDIKLNLGGVDGLAWYKDGLVAIQNGNDPARVMRIALDANRSQVQHAQALLVGLESFRAPSVGAVAGADFYLLAANEADLYNPKTGKLFDGATLRNPLVLKVNMDENWMVGQPGVPDARPIAPELIRDPG